MQNRYLKKFNRASMVVSVSLLALGFTAPTALLADDNATPVNLGAAGNFVILAKTGISTTGVTSVVGDMGISPAAATYITGFGLVANSFGPFSTSSLVTGKIYAPGYSDPPLLLLTTAVGNMQTAYSDAMGRDPNSTELGAGNIGGMTLEPGVYKWSTALSIPTNVTLSGGADDIWIFQVAQNLNVSPSAKVILSGGAQPGNIFWAVAGQTTLGTTSVFNGNILDQTAIVLNTGATLNGRALAQSAVTLDSSTVTLPAGSSSPGGSSENNGGGLDTSIGAQSQLPIAITLPISPGVTMTTMPPGCSGANKYNSSTGQPCAGNPVYPSISGVSYNFGIVTLKNGSRGEAVMELQRFLNAKLNLGLVVDGKLGPKTIVVIKKWQMDNGLKADGLIGTKTKAKMNLMAQ